MYKPGHKSIFSPIVKINTVNHSTFYIIQAKEGLSINNVAFLGGGVDFVTTARFLSNKRREDRWRGLDICDVIYGRPLMMRKRSKRRRE